MEGPYTEKICRACLKSNIGLYPLFTEQIVLNGVSLTDMITECTKLRARQNDAFPQLICYECIDRLRNAYYFKKQYEASHHVLLNFLGSINKLGGNANDDLNEKWTQTEEFELYPPDPCVKSEGTVVVKSEMVVAEITEANSDDEPMNFDFGTNDDEDPTYQPDSDSEKSLEGAPCSSKAIKESGEVIPKKEQDDSLTSDTPNNSQNDPDKHFSCALCKKMFRKCSQLNKHMMTHSKEKPHECQICHKKFGRPDNLKTHLARHEENPTKEYNRSPETKPYQKKPRQRLPNGEKKPRKSDLKRKIDMELKPYLCCECGQRFTRNYDLSVHMRIHTGEKPYKCQYCSKAFTTINQVNVHTRYHRGEKNHVCSICGKAFIEPYKLQVHQQTHSSEKPHQCPHCPKGFKRTQDLTAHMRRHTGQCYECDECGVTFIRTTTLNQHKALRHGANFESRKNRVARINIETPLEVSSNQYQ